MKNLLTGIVVFILLLVGLFIFEYGVERQEKAECLNWQDQALELPNFFLTGWQKQQCDRYQIEIDAPVEKLPRM